MMSEEKGTCSAEDRASPVSIWRWLVDWFD